MKAALFFPIRNFYRRTMIKNYCCPIKNNTSRLNRRNFHNRMQSAESGAAYGSLNPQEICLKGSTLSKSNHFGLKNRVLFPP